VTLKEAFNKAMECQGFESQETDTQYGIDIDHEKQTVHVAFEGSSVKARLDAELHFLEEALS
jgi:hypothetical protein